MTRKKALEIERALQGSGWVPTFTVKNPTDIYGDIYFCRCSYRPEFDTFRFEDMDILLEDDQMIDMEINPK